MKKITILGSTGSIGTQALEVADLHGDIEIAAISANSNVELAEKQIRKYKPKVAAMMNKKAADELKIKTADTSTKILSGLEGLTQCVRMPDIQMVLTAVVGVCGLIPTIEAIKAGKDIALANKETLVAGGSIVMPLAKQYGVKILPVDSEHSAIFQASHGQNAKITKILLTASGGPFFGKTKEELMNVPVENALKHPNWDMGAKITIDSATMMNKGLEVIEASWLFDVKPENVQVVVHRQSIIHSMVEYEDNSVIAQMSEPDMKLPISYAFSYPERKYGGTKQLDFYGLGGLSFDKPDPETFECLSLAYQAIKTGGSMPAVMNSANEEAVSLYLNKKIRFGDISEIIKTAMLRHNVIKTPTLNDLLEIDVNIRKEISIT